MKRSISPCADTRRRKSARLQEAQAERIDSTTWPDQLQIQGLKYTSRDLNLERAVHCCQVFNSFLPFARHGSSGENVRSNKANQFSTLVREIETITQSTVRKLNKKFDQLAKHTTDFISATLDVPEMYEGGDLTCKHFGLRNL